MKKFILEFSIFSIVVWSFLGVNAYYMDKTWENTCKIIAGKNIELIKECE